MSNSVIAPAILAENAEQYKEQVDKITGLVERVHIDISDGEFAPTLTVGISELSETRAELLLRLKMPTV